MRMMPAGRTPNGEDCICAKVVQLRLQPLKYTRAGSSGVAPGHDDYFEYTGGIRALDVDGDGVVPKFDPETGLWEGKMVNNSSIVVDPVTGEVTSADGDLILVSNDHYNQQCALSYFRENLRRLWRFAVALGAVLAAASVAWAGVVWMQESASGNDIARSRGMIIRVVIGVIVLSCSFLVLGRLQSWWIKVYKV